MKKVPKLRFKKFIDEYKEKKVGEIGTFLGGGTPSTTKKEYWQGVIPWISSSDLVEERIFKVNIQKYITYEALENSATKLIPKGSILIVSRVGVGKIAITTREICTSQDFINIVPFKDMNTIYLAYNIKTKLYILLNLNQGTSIKGITKKDLQEVIINFPNLQEQEKIADFLSNVDKKISITEEKLELFNEYKKGMMQKIFSQELRFKNENGNDYPEWEEKILNEYIKFGKAGGTPKTTEKKFYENGKINFLNISDMTLQGKYIYTTEKYITEEGLKNSSTWLVPKNSLIYSMYASVGFVSINKIELSTSQAMYSIIPSNNILLEYLYYFLNYLRNFINKFIEKGTQGNLSAEIIKNFIIKLPILEEQQKIADFLSAIDTKIEKISDELEELKEFKKGLLQQMFV